MKNNHRMAGSKMWVATLFMSLFTIGTSQAQLPSFNGKFTLTDQIHWGKSVLQRGDYTIKIRSMTAPIIAAIYNNKSGTAAFFVNVIPVAHDEISSRQKGVKNALLMKEKDGQLCVHSLALADFGMVLIYDPALAHERGQEARASQTVPVMLAKK